MGVIVTLITNKSGLNLRFTGKSAVRSGKVAEAHGACGNYRGTIAGISVVSQGAAINR